MVKGKNTLKKAIASYGDTAQKVMLFEEMAELQKEICKDLRGANNRDAIVEEVSDVLIMIEQIKIMFHITDEEIQKVADFKINRLKERLE